MLYACFSFGSLLLLSLLLLLLIIINYAFKEAHLMRNSMVNAIPKFYLPAKNCITYAWSIQVLVTFNFLLPYQIVPPQKGPFPGMLEWNYSPHHLLELPVLYSVSCSCVKCCLFFPNKLGDPWRQSYWTH